MLLDHIQLVMPRGRETDARAFFMNILGMAEEEKPASLAARGGCWFRANNVLLHIGVEEDFKPQKKAHPALIVSDLDALAQTLQSAGYPVSWDDFLPDRRRFYSTDPFGNRIEFLADGDGFSQRPFSTSELA